MLELDTKWKREREKNGNEIESNNLFAWRKLLQEKKKEKKSGGLVILYVFYINKRTRTWVVIK